MLPVVERFIRYAKIHTESDRETGLVPSTPGQLQFAYLLCEEMQKMGMQDVAVDDYGYVMGFVPSNADRECPSIGFIAHMDTSPDMTGKHVKPQIIENYRGNDVLLNKEKGFTLSPDDFPELMNYVGTDLIVTDGNTLLGADDKAGIAEILTAMEFLVQHPEIKHGRIAVCFTPDEEIGRGTDDFRTDVFGAKYAFTLDGEAEGEVQYESFNAARAEVYFRGNNVHPGSAKNVMVNAALVAMEFNEMLNSAQRPEYTENYQGFVHLTDMTGSVAEARLKYILRDHDRNMLAAMKAGMELAAQRLNEKYGAGTVELVIQDQYQNMAEILKDYPVVMEVARKACRNCGVSPISVPIRGATDGAILSFRGLPCPNLGTGGYAFHGPYEHLTVEGMDKMVEIVLEILRIFAE